MKKNDKISILMYKKSDNTITKRELKKLNKYFEKNSDLKEEYVLIENIRKELKNCSESPLPSDFKVKLREKLVDYNLNNAPIKNKKDLFKINITATAVLAVFLIAFSFGTNYYNTYNTSKKEIEPSYNYETYEYSEDKNGNKLTNNTQKDITANTKERIINEGKRTLNPPDNFNINTADTHKEITPYEVAKENAPIENEVVAIEENASSGGGSSMASPPLSDFSQKVSNIVIITNCDTTIFENVKMEEVEKNIFKIDIKEYNNIINILNDIPYEIKNFSEENSFKPYFYIVNEK